MPGTTYYYVCGTEGAKDPWSEVFSFTYASGASRPGGPVYAMIADFGYYNSESLGKMIEWAYEGRYDMLLHSGDVRGGARDHGVLTMGACA